MSYSLETVKSIIEDFVLSNQANTLEIFEKNTNAVGVNRAIFDIESYLVQLRLELKINERIDTTIVSKSILKHFTSVSASNAFRSVDYELIFLHFLAANYTPDKDLVNLIDDFIINFKDQFSLADIVMTQSGATRCKTNLRFALNELRELGLVLSKGKDNKRSWAPTIMGLVALLNIQVNKETFHSRTDFKIFNSLITIANKRGIERYYTYDPNLVESIARFKKTDYLYSFLTALEYETVEEDKMFFQTILEHYITFVEEGLIITDKGVRITKVFHERSKTFQAKLFSMEEENKGLHEKLFKIFRKQSDNRKII